MRRMMGVAIGVVKEIDSAEARLRVDLPWMSDDSRSAWAPVAAPMSVTGSVTISTYRAV